MIILRMFRCFLHLMIPKFKLLISRPNILIDKDDEAATFVKLLDDYCIREKDNIELGYLKGRYGAIQYTKD